MSFPQHGTFRNLLCLIEENPPGIGHFLSLIQEDSQLTID